MDFGNDLFSSDVVPNLHDELPVGDSGGTFWDEGPTLDSDLLFLDPDVLNPKICDSISSKYGFYSYASLHWAEHFALCDESASDMLRDAATELLDVKKGSCRNWLQFYRTKSVDFLDDGFIDQHPIVLAAFFNLQTALKDLLGSGNTPLAVKIEACSGRVGLAMAASLLLCSRKELIQISGRFNNRVHLQLPPNMVIWNVS